MRTTATTTAALAAAVALLLVASAAGGVAARTRGSGAAAGAMEPRAQPVTGASAADKAAKDHKLVQDILDTMPAQQASLDSTRKEILAGMEESRRRLAELDGESAAALGRHIAAVHEHLQLKRKRVMDSMGDVNRRIAALRDSDRLSIESPENGEFDAGQHELEMSIAAIKRRLAVLNAGDSKDDELELSDD